MKIVILDGYTLNPGDLDWSALTNLGDLQVFERTPPHMVVDRAADAEVIFTNKTPITAGHLAALPELRFIGVLATGFNIVDVDAASQRKIPVSNIPGYGTASVAQLTFALLLELCHHVKRHSDAVMNGRWTSSPDFSFWDTPLIELEGKTIGIIGYGDIGSRVGQIAAALGMEVIALESNRISSDTQRSIQRVSMEKLLHDSDVVSIHCPLTPETKDLVDTDFLQRMKSSAFLLNTSRGPIISEKDLALALNTGVIAGAALDVLSVEPPNADNPLLKAQNCIITPHIAWATREARARLMHVAGNNLKAFLDGKPVNIVNP